MRKICIALILLILFAHFEALAAEAIVTGKNEMTELWEGKALTASFRVGICHDKKGKAKGVLLLRHANGQEDTYHLYGTLRDNEFFLSHSSGHTFSGAITGAMSMKGKAKLKNGLRLTLKGKRTKDVPLAASDCAPLPR